MSKSICFGWICIIILSACSQNRLDVDLNEINIEAPRIQRLERDIFAMNPATIPEQTEAMKKKYGNYYVSFLSNVINRGEMRDSVYKALSYFIQDPDLKEAYAQSQKIYTDEEMNKISEEFFQAFKYFKYHFPKAETPKRFVTYISGWNYNFTPVDSTLGIGLDMYLGSDSKFYQMLQFPKYKSMQMTKEHLVSDAMKFWLLHVFDKNEPVNNLLNHMIFYGKLYYCLDAVEPDKPDSIKIAYTADQLLYCKKYERKIWAYFTEKDRLYQNDLKEIAQYTAEGPFTTAISKECPPRIAMWVGWQIVRAYMNKHKDVTLEQLMNNKDPQKILTGSKYKP